MSLYQSEVLKNTMTMLKNANQLHKQYYLNLKASKFISLKGETKDEGLNTKLLEVFELNDDADVPSYSDYIKRLLKFGKMEFSVFVMSAWLFYRIIAQTKFEKSPNFKKYSLKLYAACIFFSQKFIMDKTWKLKKFSKVLGFPYKTLEKMEVSLISLLNFDYFFDNKKMIYAKELLDNIPSYLKNTNLIDIMKKD